MANRGQTHFLGINRTEVQYGRRGQMMSVELHVSHANLSEPDGIAVPLQDDKKIQLSVRFLSKKKKKNTCEYNFHPDLKSIFSILHSLTECWETDEKSHVDSVVVIEKFIEFDS